MKKQHRHKAKQKISEIKRKETSAVSEEKEKPQNAEETGTGETQAGQSPQAKETAAETESAKTMQETAEPEKKDEKKYDPKTAAELAKLSKALEESEDKYKRMIAEYDNYRKRTAKEREGVYADAYADALKEILPVKDALELAVKYSESGKVVEGIQMTLTKFTDTLKKLGVEEFGAVDESFDPNIHNAVMHVDDETLGENTIAEVLMKGYRKGDKILRHAMVKVAN